MKRLVPGDSSPHSGHGLVEAVPPENPDFVNGHQLKNMGEIMRAHKQSAGFALVTSLLLLLLLSGIAAGTIYLIVSERSVGGNDMQDTVATYGAEAGMEKMMADVGALYASRAAPSVSDITALGGSTYQPTIPGISYNTYSFTVPANGNVPVVQVRNISSGPNQGLVAQIIPLSLTVDALQSSGADVKMVRNVEVALIPVFQFGVFSDSDLSYFPGPNFNFAGRVFTNGNLFLASGTSGNNVTFQSKVAALGQVVRAALANGLAAGPGTAYPGDINVPTAASGCSGTLPACRALAVTEGSVTGGLGSSLNPNWVTISKTTYNGMIANSLTGVHSLTLPFVASGYKSNEIIRLPWPGEPSTSNIYTSRLYSIAQIRVLLSDTPTGFPGGASGYQLANVSPYFNVSGSPAGCVALTPCFGGVSAATGVTPAQAFAEAMLQTSAGTAASLPTCDSSTPDPACVYEPGLGTGPAPAYVGGATGTNYPLGAVVTSGGTMYLSLQAGNKNHTPSSNPTWWQSAGAVAATQWSSPTYASGTTYAAGAGVTDSSGNMYISLKGGNTGKTPSSNPTWWQPADNAPNATTPRQDFILPSGNVAGNCVNSSVPYTTGNTGGGTTNYNNSANPYCMSLINGYILIQARKSDGSGTYVDVTQEWLSFGISSDVGNSINPATNNAILRFQQYRDIAPGATGDSNADVTGTVAGQPNVSYTDQNPHKYYPLQLYDPREGQFRDITSSTCGMGGIMGLIELDVHNLQRWLYGTLHPVTLTNYGINTDATSQNGYILYFSDRRGMQADPNAPTVGGWLGTLPVVGSTTSRLTGAYGFEDVINPTVTNGDPNGTLDTAEDSNQNGLLDTWGGNNVWNGFMTSAPATGGPQAGVLCVTTARKNRVSGARHALRLVNGTLGNLPGCSTVGGCTQTGGFITGGFTVASENPVYVSGNYNASAAQAFAEGSCGVPYPATTSTSPQSPCHVAAAVIADAVTLLSSTWVPAPGSGPALDLNSFINPTTPGNRSNSTANYYRLAIAAGKNLNFPQPTFAGVANDYGTDGGVHNFLRYIEGWNTTLNYMGSLVSLYYSEYATGIYKCCTSVYSPPTRAYAFDLDFLNPTLLPPGTPMFRDVNNVGFQQIFTPY